MTPNDKVTIAVRCGESQYEGTVAFKYSLSLKRLNAIAGEQYQLTYATEGTNWTSSDSSVATVSENGWVNFKDGGDSFDGKQ